MEAIIEAVRRALAGLGQLLDPQPRLAPAVIRTRPRAAAPRSATPGIYRPTKR
jgi:hypothetical protein